MKIRIGSSYSSFNGKTYNKNSKSIKNVFPNKYAPINIAFASHPILNSKKKVKIAD